VSRTVVLPVRVEGRLLPRLRGELLAHLRADPVLVVEAARVQHLSNAGQAVLVTAHRAAVARGGRVHLHQPSPEMIAALRTSGLQHLLQDARINCEAAVPAQNGCASTGQP
jgi:anti-anti-sigma regulatory factor